MTNSELIAKLEAAPQSECSCDRCKSMCLNSPCFPTPYEAKKIIDAGLADKLSLSMYQDGFRADKIHVVICGEFKDKPRRCAFLTRQGLCELHDLGLKPIEGRIASHDLSPRSGLREAVCHTWYSKAGAVMLKFFYDKYVDEDVKIKTQK